MGENLSVTNRNKKHRLNERFIKDAAKSILKILKRSSGTKLEIVFLSNSAIRPVNKRYKGRDVSTDVLSFDLDSCGQILISSDMARKNSQVFNTTFEEELILYVIHGILHLNGYDDETQRDRLKMFKKQDSIREILCTRLDLRKVLMRR